MAGYRVVFIDRDGTINRDVSYCSHPDEFELLPKVAEGIRLLNEHGFKVIVVTNQSGIARGYFSEEMLQKIHVKMKEELKKRGAFIDDAIYYCPHHPDDNCDCRKPKPGLLLQAATVLVKREKGDSNFEGSEIKPDFSCTDFYQAAKWIIKQAEKAYMVK